MEIDDSAATPIEDVVADAPANEAALLEASEDAIDIALATIEGVENRVYTREPITLPITVTYNGEKLTEGVDYTVDYDDNIKAGTATLWVYGMGNYTDKTHKTFDILPASIEDVTTIEGVEDRVYSGGKDPSVTLPIVVSLDGKKLTEGTDYTVEYDDNAKVGTATLWISGTGNYTGKVKLSFNILPATIKGVSNIGIEDGGVYDGKPHEPKVTLKVGGNELSPDKDFELYYENNVDAGMASVKITGIGNYTGTEIKTFTIEPNPLFSNMGLTIREQTYTGQPIDPITELYSHSDTMVKDVDYTLTYENNIDVGTASYTLTGIGNYTGTKTGTFSIVKAQIWDATVTGIEDTVYTGEAQAVTPTVTVGERTLIPDTDYTLTYANNTNAGDATVIITGVGNYTGEITRVFSIAQKEQVIEVRLKEGHTIDKVYDRTRNLLLTSSDFTFSPAIADTETVKITKISGSYDKPDVGTYSILVTFEISQTKSKNYTYTLKSNTMTLSGKITAKQLTIRPGVEESSSGSTLVPQSKVYGTANPSSYKAKVGGIMTGDSLASAVTGALAREEGENVGKYKITIGKLKTQGNYAATPILEEGYFEITPKSVNATDVGMVALGNQKYTGSAIEPEITLKYTKKVSTKTETETLVRGRDFDVVFTNNVEPGTATVTITGRGNYTGTRTAAFRILKTATTTSQTISVSAIGDQTYTGSAIEPGLTVVATRLVEDEVETKFLVKGVDYDVVFTNNVQPGTATAYIVGKGDYSFGKTVTFHIVKPADQAAPAVAAPAPAPAPAVPVVPAVSKSSRTTIAAAPGTVAQIDMGGATGTKYKSSNKKVATVDQNGLVTFKKAGKVKITMKVGKKKRTVTLTVKDPTIPTAIALNLSGTVPAQVGVPQALTVTLPEGTISGIKWKSSNKKVATVKNGVVTFKKAGKVTITATAARGKKKAKVKFVVTK